MSKKEDNINVNRFFPRFDEGLSLEQVEQRENEGLTNRRKVKFFKSCLDILKENILTIFNLLLSISLILWIFAVINGVYPLYYLFILISVLCLNVFLGLFHDFKIKTLLKKYSNEQNINVIRGGNGVSLTLDNIVLDDVLSLKEGDMVPFASTILTGTATVKESNLNGKNNVIVKNPGDTINPYSVIIEGSSFVRVDSLNNNKTQNIKKKTPLQKALNRAYISIGMISIVVILLSVLVFVISQINDINISVLPLVNQLSIIIPLFLDLLINIVLLVSCYSLHKSNVLVLNKHSLEALSRSDVVCFDKTGTLTDDSLVVQSIVSFKKPLGDSLDNDEINDILFNLLNATQNIDEKSKIISEFLKPSIKSEMIASLPYVEANRYSAVSLASGMTYVLGEIDVLNIQNKEEVLSLTKSYKDKGLSVLLLGKSNQIIKGRSFNEKIKPLAFVIFKEKVKEDSKELISYLYEQNIDIKLISGDNLSSVVEIGNDIGIKQTDKAISLLGISVDNIPQLVDQYVVFADASKEQKEAIVKSLKENNKKVTMIGDGYNDLSALIEADCSISMNNGLTECKNISDIILLNNNFSSLKETFIKGKKNNNLLQKLSSLYLVKSFVGAIISFVFLFVSALTSGEYNFPIMFSNLFFYEGISILLAFIFLIFDKNDENNKKNISKTLHQKVLFASGVILLSTLIVSVLYLLQINNVFYTGIESYGFNKSNPLDIREGYALVLSLTITLTSLMSIIIALRPLNRYQKVFISIISVLMLGLLSLFYFTKINIFGLDFATISLINILVVVSSTIISSAIILVIQSIVIAWKGKK